MRLFLTLIFLSPNSAEGEEKRGGGRIRFQDKNRVNDWDSEQGDERGKNEEEKVQSRTSFYCERTKLECGKRSGKGGEGKEREEGGK